MQLTRARLAVTAFLTLVVSAPSGPVKAGERQRVAVLEIVIEGDAPPELRGQLAKSLAGGLHVAGFEVVALEQVDVKLGKSPELRGCLTSTCLERAAELVGTPLFARARVKAEGAAYLIEVWLLSAERADGPMRRIEKSCAVCTIDEANELMSAAGAELGREGGARVAVRIVTDPPGATIEVDGVPAGESPVELELEEGDHEIRATSAGRAAARSTVAVTTQAGGETQVVTLMLAPEVAGPGPSDGGSRFGPWKWAAAGGGAAALMTGVWLIAIDGDATDCPPGAVSNSQCESFWNTGPSGAALTVTGLALGGAAAYMFLKDRPRRHGGQGARGPRLTAGRVAAGGAAVGVLGWGWSF